MNHTKGSHCDPAWSAVAGSWWGEPCFCDAIQPLTQTITFPPTNNAAPNPNNFGNSFSFTAAVGGNGNMTVPYFWLPVQEQQQVIVYPQTLIITGHICDHTCQNKVMSELVKVLVDKITELSSKIGTDNVSPVKETRGNKK